MRNGLQAAALALACAVATLAAGSLELRLGPELVREPWRLWTAHLAHAGAAHFALDVGAGVALVLLGASLASFAWIAPVVALGVLCVRPDLGAYVGLSGVLHAWFAQVARRRAPWLLIVVALKVAWELATGGTTMGGFPLGAAPVPEAHAVGLLAGYASVLASRSRSVPRTGSRSRPGSARLLQETLCSSRASSP